MSEENDLFKDGIFNGFHIDKKNNINNETKKFILLMGLSIYNNLKSKIDNTNGKLNDLNKKIEDFKNTNNYNYKNIINVLNNLNNKIDKLENTNVIKKKYQKKIIAKILLINKKFQII